MWSCSAQLLFVVAIVWSCDDFTDGAPFEQCDMDLDVYHGTETVDVVTDPLGIHEDVVRVMYPEVNTRQLYLLCLFFQPPVIIDDFCT